MADTSATESTESFPPQPTPAPAGQQAHFAQAPSARPSKGPSLGLVAFCLGSVAFLPVGYPVLRLLALPLGGLGVCLAVVGLHSAVNKGKGWPLPSLAAVLSLFAVVVAIWPSVLHGPGLSGVPSVSAVHHGLGVVPRSNEQRQNPQPIGPSTWVDARRWAVRWENLEIRVASVRAASLNSVGLPADVSSAREVLVVLLEVSSAEAGPRQRNAGWGVARVDGTFSTLSARDGRGQSVRQLDPAQVDPAALRLTRSAGALSHGRTPQVDVLLFEAPTGPNALLRLELPGEPLGMPHVLRLEIPAAMIARTPDDR